MKTNRYSRNQTCEEEKRNDNFLEKRSVKKVDNKLVQLSDDPRSSNKDLDRVRKSGVGRNTESFDPDSTIVRFQNSDTLIYNCILDRKCE